MVSALSDDEKAWIAINHNPKQILEVLAEVRPHYMCNVPRFWEKVYGGV